MCISNILNAQETTEHSSEAQSEKFNYNGSHRITYYVIYVGSHKCRDVMKYPYLKKDSSKGSEYKNKGII